MNLSSWGLTHHHHSQQNTFRFWSGFDHISNEQPLGLKYSLFDHDLLMLEHFTQILLAAFELQESDTGKQKHVGLSRFLIRQ